MVTVANPIYDIVFKYLMEDERIARTILSALLRKDIVRVEMRPQEFADDKDGKIALYRIDFGATVREPDGTERRILIELQKTWVDTETLRFRQYLGFQYSSAENVGDDGFALPMVTVYLLGHKVGDIEEPVLYVHRSTVDYEGRPVTKGLPNPFVDSLTHDSIIVQIPRLHGQVNNRLDEVLSFFDQSRKVGNNRHLLQFEDTAYEDDEDMQHILNRLLKAAASTDMRRRMDIEDEYYSALEKRDTIILQKDQQLEAMNQQLQASVRMLFGLGQTPEAIAESLNIDLQTVKKLIG